MAPPPARFDIIHRFELLAGLQKVEYLCDRLSFRRVDRQGLGTVAGERDVRHLYPSVVEIELRAHF